MTVKWDKAAQICEIRHDHCTLNSQASVDEWARQLEAGLAPLNGDRAYFLIDMHGLELEPQFADAYGQVAKRVLEQYALGAFRYGDAAGMTVASVRLQSVIQRFPSNIFRDETAALTALKSRAHSLAAPMSRWRSSAAPGS